MSRPAGTLIVVLGGASSGKSQVALEMAGTRRPRAFVATGQALDGEMAERIRRHRGTRSADWVTAEVPVDVTSWFEKEGARYRTIVLDCMTLWLSNLWGSGRRGPAVFDAVSELLRAVRAVPARVVIVSNELGLGLVPARRSARSFRDMAGRINQQLAAEADEVYLVVAGQPLPVKGAGVR